MDLTPRFKLVFICVFALTVACLLLSVFLAYGSDPPERVINELLGAFKMGFGALVGLLGGKAL